MDTSQLESDLLGEEEELGDEHDVSFPRDIISVE